MAPTQSTTDNRIPCPRCTRTFIPTTFTVQTCFVTICSLHQTSTPTEHFRALPISFPISPEILLKRQSIDDAANTFKISDLRPAIADFLTHHQSASADQSGYINVVGGRRIAQQDCPLPVEELAL